jgi:phospholipid/cholesterol/gamma-HCH transport system ATP-binding protein
MRKRAALARALALDPPLLFCDEPSAGLDPVTLDALDTLILQLKNQLKMTIILVTHEVSSIFRLADRIVFLDDGEVIYQGELEQALKSDRTQVLEFFKKAKGKN